MNFQRRLIVSLFTVAVIAGQEARAQATVSKPDARTLCQQAEQAMAKLAAFEYTAEYWMPAEGGVERVAVEVIVGHPANLDMPIDRAVRVTWPSADKSAAPVVATFDGSTLRHQMADTKQVWKETFQPKGGVAMLPIFEALLPGVQSAELAPLPGATLELGEPISVDGRPCDVLVATNRRPSPEGGTAVTEFQTTIAIERATHHVLQKVMTLAQVDGDARNVVFTSGITVKGGLRALKSEPTDWSVPMPKGWTVDDHDALAAAEAASRLKVGTQAPAWTLNDGEGRPHALSELRGRVVLLDFWATWCGPCKMAMPELQKLHEKYRERGLTVVGISAEGPKAGDPVAYFHSKNYTYLDLVKGDDVAKAYGVSGIPHLFVIGPDGAVVEQFIGWGDDLAARIEKVIEPLLPNK